MKHWKVKISTIWFGQAISLLSSSIMQMALIWYITMQSGSATYLSLAAIMAYLPQALLGPFAGAIVDRFNKKYILIFSDLFISAVSLFLGIFAFLGDLPLWMIILVLAFRSIGTAFHDSASKTIISMFVPQDKLANAAGFNQAFDSVSMLLSPGLAIWLYEFQPLWIIILMDVAGAFLAALLLLCVKFPKQNIQKANLHIKSLTKEVKDGLDIIRKYKGITALLLTGMLYILLYAPVGVLYPHITMVYFNGSTAEAGFVEIIFSLGSLIGALLLGVLGSKISKSLGLIGSMTAYGAGVFISGCLNPDAYLTFVILSFFIGISVPFYHGIVRVIIQLTIPEDYLGRVFAVSRSSTLLAMPVGLAIAGPVADFLGANVLYMILGGLAVILALVLRNLNGYKNLHKLVG